MEAARRKLVFTSLGEVMPEVERLLAGHTTVGRWSLGQILNHLALTIRLPLDGFPAKFSWPVRRLFGPVARRLSFRLGWIPAGVWVPEVYLPPQGLDAGREAEALRLSIRRFGASAAPLDEHPLLGRMSLAEWERFHRLHCAHHLGFVVPAAREGAPERRDANAVGHSSEMTMPPPCRRDCV